jgi:membrane protease YdiL (CAAX protease family)
MTPSSVEASQPTSPSRSALAVALGTLLFAAALVTGRPLSIWLTTGIAALATLALAIWADRGELRRLLTPSRRAGLIGLASGAVLITLTYALFPLALRLLPGIEAPVLLLYRRLGDYPGPFAALPVLTLVVVTEELAWRGLLTSQLERRALSPSLVVLTATLLYALPQIAAESWIMLPVALACGLVWSLTRSLSGDLTAPIISHLTWDLAVFVLVPLAPVS